MVSEIVFRQTLGLLENTRSPSGVAAHAERRHKEPESILFYFCFVSLFWETNLYLKIVFYKIEQLCEIQREFFGFV